MHRLTRPWMGQGGGGGRLWSSSALIRRTIKTLLTFVWPKSKPWSLRLIHLSAQAFTPLLSLHFFCFCILFFFFLFKAQPLSFGQDIKLDPRGSDSSPFPTRWINTVTTANFWDYDSREEQRVERWGRKCQKLCERK